MERKSHLNSWFHLEVEQEESISPSFDTPRKIIADLYIVFVIISTPNNITTLIINLQRACAARIAVVSCVCLFVTTK